MMMHTNLLTHVNKFGSVPHVPQCSVRLEHGKSLILKGKSAFFI